MQKENSQPGSFGKEAEPNEVYYHSRESLEGYLKRLLFKYKGTNISISAIVTRGDELHDFEVLIRDISHNSGGEQEIEGEEDKREQEGQTLLEPRTEKETKEISLEAARLDMEGKTFREIIQALEKHN